MKRPLKLLLFFIFAFSLCGPFVFGEEVRYVIDGDTFILANNQRVRMIGINAPEVSHRRYNKQGQSYGKEARKHLEGMILKKDVTLKSGAEEFDRYGRRLSYVYLQDGTFVNLKMVKDGFAETYRKFPFEYKEDFLKVEDEARAAKLGMWAGEKGVSWKDSWKELLAELGFGD